MKKREGIIKGRIKNVLNFKKPAAWVLIISVLAVIFWSVCQLKNPALKLELPDATSVLSMEMEQINEGTSVGCTTVTDSEDIKTVLSTLSGARKTLTQSVNDYPAQENYLVVRLVLEREEKTLFLYTQWNGYYVEESYIGVYKYKSDRNTNAAIHKVYNDRLSAATRSLAQLTLDEVYEIKRSDEPWKLLGNADLNRDGLIESIYLDQSELDNGSVTLRITDCSGKDIWSEQASTSHAGWTSLFLCEEGGEYYLLRYLPGMWQGYCTYTYTLFTLEGGAEHIVRNNTIEFDVNGVNKLDAPNMIAFTEEVNALLGKSTLLLSSEGGKYSFGPSSADRFFERYSWLDETPELYAEGDDLKTRLVKYSEYAVSNRR